MSSTFFTEISSQHVSAGVEVTNINGDIFNTTIYIIDSERESGDLDHLAQILTGELFMCPADIDHLVSLLAEARAPEHIEARTRSNVYGRAHEPDMQVSWSLVFRKISTNIF